MMAQKLNSTGYEILDILSQSRCSDGFDNAINLLSRYGDDLIKVVNSGEVDKSSEDRNNTAIEEEWEVLIKGIACAYNLSVEERFDTITRLISGQKSRLVKASIIDALLIIQDEIKPDFIKKYLTSFLSSDEVDEYIRDYAQEAIDDIDKLDERIEK